MREPDSADHALDDVGGQRGLEHVLGMSRGTQEVDRSHAEGGDERQRAPRAFGQRRESSADQLVQALRDRERLRRVEVHGQRSGELERVEGIAARGLVDAEQRRSREDAVEPLAEDCLQCAGAERANPQPLERGRRECVLEWRSVALLD